MYPGRILCLQSEESLHLFFESSFSSRIWEAILSRFQIRRRAEAWDRIKLGCWVLQRQNVWITFVQVGVGCRSLPPLDWKEFLIFWRQTKTIRALYPPSGPDHSKTKDVSNWSHYDLLTPSGKGGLALRTSGFRALYPPLASLADHLSFLGFP